MDLLSSVTYRFEDHPGHFLICDAARLFRLHLQRTWISKRVYDIHVGTRCPFICPTVRIAALVCIQTVRKCNVCVNGSKLQPIASDNLLYIVYKHISWFLFHALHLPPLISGKWNAYDHDYEIGRAAKWKWQRPLEKVEILCSHRMHKPVKRVCTNHSTHTSMPRMLTPRPIMIYQ